MCEIRAEPKFNRGLATLADPSGLKGRGVRSICQVYKLPADEGLR